MNLICLLVGHSWQYLRKQQYLKNGEMWEQSWIVQRPCCKRCGKPNPAYKKDQPK